MPKPTIVERCGCVTPGAPRCDDCPVGVLPCRFCDTTGCPEDCAEAAEMLFGADDDGHDDGGECDCGRWPCLCDDPDDYDLGSDYYDDYLDNCDDYYDRYDRHDLDRHFLSYDDRVWLSGDVATARQIAGYDARCRPCLDAGCDHCVECPDCLLVYALCECDGSALDDEIDETVAYWWMDPDFRPKPWEVLKTQLEALGLRQ